MNNICECGVPISEYTYVKCWDEQGKEFVLKIKKSVLDELYKKLKNVNEKI